MIRNCPPTKHKPPCNENQIEKIKEYKDGTKSICCYKNTSKTIKKKILK